MPALRGKKLAEEILRQADRLEGKFRTAYLRSVLKLADDKELKKLLDDIDKGRFSFGDSVDARLNNIRIDVAEMNEIARQAISGSAKITNQVMGLKGSFEVVNDSVIDAAKKLSVDLSTNLTRTAKESLRQIIEDQLSGNISRQEAVRRITMEVGLLPQHAKAVSNYRKTLISAGTPRGQANRMAEQYAKRLLKYRANMIARTEVARATGIGQTNFWRQMRDQGVLPPSTNRIWITAMDERACEFCRSMNGEIATIDGGWDTPKGYMEYPQASHPHCRCSSGITTSRPTKSGRAGRIAKVEELEYDLWLSKVGDKPGHPFRGNQYTQANKHAKEIDKKLRAIAGDSVADTWKPLVQEAMTTWYGQGDMQAPITVKGKKILVGGHEISTQGVLDTMADALGVNAISQGRGFGADDVFSKGDKPGHPFRGNQWTGRGHKNALGPENVEMQLANPITRLAKRHKIKNDWSKVNAVDPSRRKQVAGAYSKMKAFDDSPEVKKSWDDAEVEIKKQFKQLTEKDGIKVEFVDKDPYSSFHDMSTQVNETGVLKVLRTEQTGGHPYWSNETNDMFRAVHDAYGHLGTGRGFDRHGEEAAYQAHKSMFPESAHSALATELRGQNQFLIQTGAFGDQKIGFLPVDLQKQDALVEKAFSGSGLITADDDNSYSMGGSHHVSGGRHFAGSQR